MVCALQLDFHVHAGGEVELHQRVHGFRRRIENVEHPLVGTDLELLARLLVDVKRSIRVGSGIGPRTCAPVRLAVFTISCVDWSSTR